MGNSLLNRCVFNADAAGTGDFVVDDAVSGYLTPSDAGAVNAASYSYSAESNEGLEWEIGTTVYTAATSTFSRTPLLSSNSNALVNFSTSPRVAITVLANDILSPTFSGSVIFNSTATFNGTTEFNSTSQFDGTASFTVPAEFADGTAALPSITNIGDIDTGIYFSAADEVSITTGGTRRLQINSTGHTITGALSVSSTGTFGGAVDFPAGAVGTPSLTTTGDLNTGMWFPAADTIAFSTAGSERLRISSAGLTSVTGTFSVSGSTSLADLSTSNFIVVNGGAIYIDGVPNGYLIFRNTANTEKAEIRYIDAADSLTLGRSGLTNALSQNSSNIWLIGGSTVWHAGNDGAGSGLDADLLDGISSADFVQFTTSTTASMSFVIDEDTMSSNLDTKVPTQQSTKAYVDSKSPIGTQAIWIPAGSMQPTTTNGAAYYSTELATNDVMLNGYAFDTTTAENVCFFVALPKQWDEGTVTFRAYWTAASGSGGVAWSLAAMSRSDDDAMDNTYGTAQTVTDSLITANDMHVTSVSSAITIGSTPAENDVQFFKLTRAVSNGSDTLAVDAILLGIEMKITTNASTDA